MAPTVAVVGAGISGSVIANLVATKIGADVDVFEKRPVFGGNCYDYDDDGIMVHEYGSHIFHTSIEEVWDFISVYANFNNYVHRVRIVIDGVETKLPFNFGTIDDLFSKDKADRLKKKLLDLYAEGTKVTISDFLNQNDPEIRQLADFVFEKVYRHYTEKQWGVKISDLDKGVSARVPIIIGYDDRYFHDLHEGIPKCGYTSMIGNMLDQPKIKLHLSTDAKDVDLTKYDHVFYTGSIDELLNYKYGHLPYRSVSFEKIKYETGHYQSNSVINYPSEDVRYTRTHEYKYYVDSDAKNTIIAKEYPSQYVFNENEPSYPILNADNNALYRKYLLEIGEKYPNIHALGRLADYQYYDMDKAICRAINVFKEVFE